MNNTEEDILSHLQNTVHIQYSSRTVRLYTNAWYKHAYFTAVLYYLNLDQYNTNLKKIKRHVHEIMVIFK